MLSFKAEVGKQLHTVNRDESTETSSYQNCAFLQPTNEASSNTRAASDTVMMSLGHGCSTPDGWYGRLEDFGRNARSRMGNRSFVCVNFALLDC